MKILITGGAGFIGSALIRHIIKNTEYEVLNLDKLTYAGNLQSVKEVSDSKRYSFAQADICDKEAVSNIFNDFKPTAIMHLVDESLWLQAKNGAPTGTKCIRRQIKVAQMLSPVA